MTSITEVTVTGEIDLPNGRVADGYVQFTLSHRITDPAGDVIIDPVPVRAQLSTDGTFSTGLYATNDPDAAQTGQTYLCEVFLRDPSKGTVKRHGTAFSFALDYQTSPVDLADLSPVESLPAISYGLHNSGRVLIESKVIASDGDDFEFSDISGVFDSLEVVVLARSNRAAVTETVVVQVGNGSLDTGANYGTVTSIVDADGTSSGAGTIASTSVVAGSLPGTTADAAAWGWCSATVYGYATDQAAKRFETRGAVQGNATNTNEAVLVGGGVWRDTDTVDTLTVSGVNGDGFREGDQAWLIGLGSSIGIPGASEGGGTGVTDGDKGDITVSSSGAQWTIDNEAVTLAKLAHVATSTLLGRTTAATGEVEVLTATQVRALLNVEDGADVTDTTNVAAAGAVMASTVDAAGDLLVGTADDTVGRLALGGALQHLRVNAGGTALEYADPPSPGGGEPSDGDKGDITVSTGGTVWTIDNGAVTAAKVAADVATQAELDAHAADTTSVHGIADTANLLDLGDIGATVQAHSAVLDATTASFTTADETKLDGIEELADVTGEANVVAAIDGATLPTATVAGTDKVLIQDADDNDELKTVTAQSIADLGGGGVTDGDKGDITVSGSGATWTIDAGAVDASKVAADVATQAELDAHVNDSSDAHDASAISVADAGGNYTATDVEAALAEVYDDLEVDVQNLADHEAEATGAHAGSAISLVDTGDYFDDHNVEDALQDLAAGLAAGVSDGDKGDITVSGSGATWTVDDEAITFAKMQHISEDVFLGRDETGTGDVEELTPAEARALLNVEDGAAADQTAAEVTVADAGGNFTTDNVEAALAQTYDELEVDVQNLADHEAESTGAHAASAISIVDAGGDFTATDVEGALAELQADHEADATALSDHLADDTDAHDASAVSYDNATSGLTATDVQAAVDEVEGRVDTLEGGVFLTDGDKGDITVSGSGATWNIDANAVGSTELADEAVTLAKLAHVATDSFLGRDTASTGDVEVLDAATARGVLNVEDGADVTGEANVTGALDGATIPTATVATGDKVLVQDVDDNDELKTVTAQSIADLAGGGVSDGDKGDITVSGSGATWTVDDEAVTFAKMQHVATDTFLGRDTAGTGDVESITASAARTILNVEDGADVTDTANVTSSISGASLTTTTAASDDKVLVQDTSNSNALRTVTITGMRKATFPSVPVVSGTTDTLDINDHTNTIRYTNASLVTVTLPTDASDDLPDGFWCMLFAGGAGGLTLSTTGITLGGSSPLKTIARNQAMLVQKTEAANTWLVIGGTAT